MKTSSTQVILLIYCVCFPVDSNTQNRYSGAFKHIDQKFSSFVQNAPSIDFISVGKIWSQVSSAPESRNTMEMEEQSIKSDTDNTLDIINFITIQKRKS